MVRQFFCPPSLAVRINTISESESSSFKKLKVERRSRLSRPYHPSIILVDIVCMSVLQPIEKAVMVHVRKGLNLLHDNARQFP